MAFTFFRRAAVFLTLMAAVGCTVKDTKAPALAGPSGLALQLTVNAIPDSISQDGGSQSSIKVTAIGPDGKAISALPVRMDILVNGVPQDFGTLSGRSVVTNGDGVASVVYTAPPSSPNGSFGFCNGLPGTCVTIVATASASNFDTANPQSAQIRLVPPGVILPPASAPTAAFTYSPTPVSFNVPVIFDASTSTAGTGASSITNYAWSFGDGTSGSGKSVTHTFTGSGASFNVSLTVTNDRGLSASTSQTVGVSASPAPSGDWVFSPTSPIVGDTIFFNGDAIKAAPGHTLVQFTWNFGDGGSASGFQATHVFAQGGTYTVVLSVADDAGQKIVVPKTLTVASGAPTVVITFSPATAVHPGTIGFSSNGTIVAGGASITTYSWDFGDPTSGSNTSSVASPSHTFNNAGSYTIRLTVTDSVGRVGTTTVSVTIS
jgi:PKD repeat protein